jgi:hypothetical protein
MQSFRVRYRYSDSVFRYRYINFNKNIKQEIILYLSLFIFRSQLLNDNDAVYKICRQEDIR